MVKVNHYENNQSIINRIVSLIEKPELFVFNDFKLYDFLVKHEKITIKEHEFAELLEQEKLEYKKKYNTLYDKFKSIEGERGNKLHAEMLHYMNTEEYLKDVDLLSTIQVKQNLIKKFIKIKNMLKFK